MYQILRPKISPYFFVVASLLWCNGTESKKGKVLDIDSSTWNSFAILVNGDRSQIFKHQDIGNILIANYTVGDGFGSGGDGDDHHSTGRKWASTYMSTVGKNLEDALFPKLWLPSSLSALENISLTVELESAFQVFGGHYLKPSVEDNDGDFP